MSTKKNNQKEIYTKQLEKYIHQEQAAVSLINYSGKLLYEKGVELVLFRRHLIDTTITKILRLHHYAKNFVKKPINVVETNKIVKNLYDMDLCPSKIDIGKLTFEWIEEKSKHKNRSVFLSKKLNFLIKPTKHEMKPKDVILFGFGRIGRLCTRELIKQAGKGQQLRLRAVVVRSVDEKSLKKRASLLLQDSVHGRFSGSLEIDNKRNSIIVNGQNIVFLSSEEKIEYKKIGIKNALLIDSTGIYKEKKQLKKHLNKYVKKVILTAPGNSMPNIVYGVNHKQFDFEKENIFSAASCTTNAIAPILYVINKSKKIVKGHIETIHAYTNDQNLLDNMHGKNRRGRSAAINMVITSTGAGKAISKIMPHLDGKLTANAIRVPTPNGSLAVMSLDIKNKTSLEEINEILRKSSLSGELVNQIKYSINEELVSNDIIGTTGCSIFDSKATIVSKSGKNIILYVWYDNEFGYTKQVIRLAKYISGVRRLHYY
ncbi:MAG: glyceraldehyde-3-phosphate dehydrogenase [Flavobacteriales bacterium]|nr:glyceraldehyde-3-phosphate dehydrogenase [Flavobacteriales bacterium]|tara:strand:+ start:13022 stop:14479 length:1458 start_codon:yes stop_codon:yes gene_type:complete